MEQMPFKITTLHDNLMAMVKQGSRQAIFYPMFVRDSFIVDKIHLVRLRITREPASWKKIAIWDDKAYKRKGTAKTPFVVVDTNAIIPRGISHLPETFKSALREVLRAIATRTEKENFAYLPAAGKILEMCCICGAGLTDPVSAAAGIGPVCAEKIFGGKDARQMFAIEEGLATDGKDFAELVADLAGVKRKPYARKRLPDVEAANDSDMEAFG